MELDYQDDVTIVGAVMMLDTGTPQMKTLVAKIMVKLSMAGTIQKVIEEREAVSNTTTSHAKSFYNVRMIGTRRSVHDLTLLIGKLSKQYGNFRYHLLAVSKDVRAILNGDFDYTSCVAGSEHRSFTNLGDFTEIFAGSSVSSMAELLVLYPLYFLVSGLKNYLIYYNL